MQASLQVETALLQACKTTDRLWAYYTPEPQTCAVSRVQAIGCMVTPGPVAPTRR